MPLLSQQQNCCFAQPEKPLLGLRSMYGEQKNEAGIYAAARPCTATAPLPILSASAEATNTAPRDLRSFFLAFWSFECGGDRTWLSVHLSGGQSTKLLLHPCTSRPGRHQRSALGFNRRPVTSLTSYYLVLAYAESNEYENVLVLGPC